MSTLTQAEVDSATNTNQVGTYNTPTEVIADKFIGELIGNATTAKALQKNWRLRLVGDVSGYADLNASDADLKVTVNEASHARTADFVGSANYAATTALADLANLATFALETGCLRNFIIKFTEDSAIQGSMTWDSDTSTATINVDKIDLVKSGVLLIENVTEADKEKLDTSKIYFDVKNSALWFYTGTEWKNLLQYITDYLVTLTNKDTEQQKQIDKNTADIADLQPTKYTVTFNNKTYSMRNTLVDEVSNG
jgi:hypothetical protein